MKIAIDIRPALVRGTGVGTFIEQLSYAMDRAEGDHEIKLFSSSYKDRWDTNRISDRQKSTLFDKKWPVKVLNSLWHWFSWPKVENLIGDIDIAQSPTPLILPSKNKKITTIHDLYFLQNPEQTHAEIRRDYARLVSQHSQQADGIIAVSEATAKTAKELLGIPDEKICVSLEDASPVFDMPPTHSELDQLESVMPYPFFLFVGTIEPRKNLHALIEAFHILSRRFPDIRLIIAGTRGWGTEQFDEAMKKFVQSDRVYISGYRDQRSIRALYHKAVALVMPSLCEGFGLPLVEAMACGCPLIVNDNSALPEVAGEAACYWLGESYESLAELMENVMTDSDLRASMINHGRKQRAKFSWARSAERVLKFYQTILDY